MVRFSPGTETKEDRDLLIRGKHALVWYCGHQRGQSIHLSILRFIRPSQGGRGTSGQVHSLRKARNKTAFKPNEGKGQGRVKHPGAYMYSSYSLSSVRLLGILSLLTTSCPTASSSNTATKQTGSGPLLYKTATSVLSVP